MSSGSASRGSSGCRSRATIVSALESWEEPAGGGAVAAAELVRLGAEVDFFVAVGNDEVGEQAQEALRELGCRVHAARRDEAQRLAFTYLDSEGERTITLLGPKLHPRGSDPLPWDVLADIDAVYFTAGTQTRCGLRGRLAPSSRRPANCQRSWKPMFSSTRSSAAGSIRARPTSRACSNRSRS